MVLIYEVNLEHPDTFGITQISVYIGINLPLPPLPPPPPPCRAKTGGRNPGRRVYEAV